MSTQLRDLAVHLATAAGERAAAARVAGVAVSAHKSTPTDVVTAADRQTEAYLREELARARPGDGFCGEEDTTVASRSGLTWVIDPIDGTVNYLYDIPAWAVSVAVVEGEPRPGSWRTVAASVVNPCTSEVYAAAAGEGSTLNGRALRIAPKTELASALAGTGFAYAAADRRDQAIIVAAMIDRVRDIRRMGAASLDLCGVAAGRLDVYWERGLNPWDHAAGALIAREAGAVVGGLTDGTVEGRGFILAANPGLADDFRALLEEVGAQGG